MKSDVYFVLVNTKQRDTDWGRHHAWREMQNVSLQSIAETGPQCGMLLHWWKNNLYSVVNTVNCLRLIQNKNANQKFEEWWQNRSLDQQLHYRFDEILKEEGEEN